MNGTPTLSPLTIGARDVGPGAPCYVIAEVGINHEGSVETCAKLIEQAAKAGADAVKLQTVDVDETYAPGTESHTVFSAAELTPEETGRMFEYGREIGIDVFTTAGDLTALAWIEKLEPVAYKISSGLLTALPIIRKTAATGRPVLMSTGMASPEDVDAAVDAARTAGGSQIGLFQCTSLYPAPPETLNLRSIRWLSARYGVPVGFSDHSLGIEAAPLSVAAGAVMIEKHFSLDTGRPGFDHRISLNPDAFAAMIQAIRQTEAALGVDGMPLNETVAENAKRYLRTLAARRDLPAGTVLGADDIGIMRLAPENRGLAPVAFDGVVGRTLKSARARYEPIRDEDLA
ncbi:MAG: N-acetylneuraminate synthase family protein [Rhodospirillales bacterium]